MAITTETGRRQRTTKIRKFTKITKSFLVILVIFVIFVPPPWRVSPQAQQAPQAQPPTQAQQRPVFRGGTHFVRVDAYPTQKDGRVAEGLSAEDFEIFEDGKPQTIDSFDFVKFDTFTPEDLRVEPRTQQEGFDMAADPRTRVFVIVVDLPAQPAGQARTDIKYIEQPLINFLDRVLTTADLYGFLTSRNTAKDLVLGRKTAVVNAQIRDMFRFVNIERDDADTQIDRCPIPPGKNDAVEKMKTRFRVDQLYTSLESLVHQLGAIRQERKSVIFVANGISRAKPVDATELTQGKFPKIGIDRGRVGIGGHADGMNAYNEQFCTSEMQRLAALDFDERYRELLKDSRRDNVSFYVITPEGLTMHRPSDDLIALANNTDGLAIVNTNDLDRGMRRIADDLSAYYVLGYYTTNTNFDGGVRAIQVKLRSTGKPIRARRQYKAPTREELAALSAPPAAATAKATAPAPKTPTLVGKPSASLVHGKASPEPADVMRLTRTDRLRVEWPVTGQLDQRVARVLDRTGKPMAFDLPASEQGGKIAIELSLAPFARGDYSIELTIGSGTITERSLLPFRIQ